MKICSLQNLAGNCFYCVVPSKLKKLKNHDWRIKKNEIFLIIYKRRHLMTEET
jgi:hypothetical protein